ncbi:MAG: hypothetical protein HY234_01715 [Acidobacteria bacterium]|nr:hypothetical protein [Acidobacteriota bacterium]MBI3661755.1 hypothetical protein [Acidobacteriota bacterium]
MKKFLLKLLSLLVAIQLSLGAPAAVSQSAPQTPPQAQAVATQSATRMVLEDGTPVKLPYRAI